MLCSPVNNHRHALENVTNSSPAQAGTLTKAKTNHKSAYTPQTAVATRLYRGTGTLTVQTPKSSHWLLAPTPKKSPRSTKPEKHQTSADPEEPQWLTEAETILARCPATGLRPESEANCVGDDATSRVALSWLSAGACDSASTRASLCLAEVRSATAERALKGEEARSLRAEVSALQARQAELEVQGEADAARREADAVQRERLLADEARATAEASLVLASSQLQQAQQQAQQQAEEAEQQQQAQQQAQQQLGTRLVASEAARDSALDVAASEQSKRAGLEKAKAGLEQALLSKSKALLEATTQLAALRDARPPPQQASGGGFGGEATVRSGAAAPRCDRKRDEIRRVTLHKPEASSRLGIRLAGDERPRVVSLNPGLLAAKAGGLAVNDVILSVNGREAQGHTATTRLLKTARGAIKIELFTPTLSSEVVAAGGEVTEADTGQQAAPNPTLSSLTRRHQRPTHVSAPAVLPAAAPRAAPTKLQHGPRHRPRSEGHWVAVAENGKFRWEFCRA